MLYKQQTKENIWLCIRFTNLGLNSLGFTFNEENKRGKDSQVNDTQQAIAVTHQQLIHSANAEAISSGVKPGMSVSYALLVNASLELHQREQRIEQQKLKTLSHWAYQFTSLVSQHGEHSLVLEIGKSELLFNSLDNILKIIKEDLASFKVDALFGISNTPKASILLSLNTHQTITNSENQIDSVSLNVIDQPRKKIAQLNHCGFKTLGDIKKIKRPDLGARFGRELLTYLSQVYGDLPDPQHAITPPETFHSYIDFAEPIQNSLWIQQQIDKLLDELSLFVSTRQLLCRSFTWRFYHENNRLIKAITIGVNSQEKLDTTIKKLTRLKLESTKLKWEFSRIELSCKDLLAVQLFNGDLFEPSPSNEQLQQLKDKLISRLGGNVVYSIEAREEYLPEMANRQHIKSSMPLSEQQVSHWPNHPSNDQTVHQDKNKSPKANSKREVPHDQPLWLLEQPLKLQEHCSQPVLKGPLSFIHGPNRLTSQWWHKPQSRDYFIARQNTGCLLWVFYDRVNKAWFMHGLYG